MSLLNTILYSYKSILMYFILLFFVFINKIIIIYPNNSRDVYFYIYWVSA